MAMSENRRSSGNGSFTGLFIVAIAVWLLFFGGLRAVQRATQGYATSGQPVVSTIQNGAQRLIATPVQVSSIPVSGAPRPASVIATPIPGIAANESEAQAQYDAAVAAGNQNVQAPVQVQEAPVAAPAAVQQLPTAVIAVPTVVPVAMVTVVPIAYPQVYASNSPPTATLAPTLAIPTPLSASDLNMVISPDGKCVTATRRNSGGKRFQACQDWGYKDYEAKSTAEMLYTGLIPGIEVKQ